MMWPMDIPDADTAGEQPHPDFVACVAATRRDEVALEDRNEWRRELYGFGTSFLVHTVAIIVLALLVTPVEKVLPVLTITSQQVPEEAFVEFNVVEVPQPPVELVHHLDGPAAAVVLLAGSENDLAFEGARDAMDDAFQQAIPVQVDDTASQMTNPGSLLATIGAGTNGDGRDADGLGATIGFYGVKASGRRFVFVTDCSSSMSGPPFQRLKTELRASINALPRKAEFFVVFFNNDALPMPSQGLVKATPEHKNKYLEWADQVPSDGGTDPSKAMEIALGLQPSVVFLLTDGAFSPEPTFAVIERLNELRRVRINTIAIGERAAEQVLQRIAKENKGAYRFVPQQ